jgi:hypothetical protein
MEEPFGCHSKLDQQVEEVLAAYIPQFHPLEISPDAFIGVQLRSVGWQGLKVQSRRGPLGQKLLNRIAAMDGCPIPDHHHFAGDLLQKPLEELDYSGPLKKPSFIMR